MRKFNFYLLALILLVFVPACSSDDDTPTAPTYNYFVSASEGVDIPVSILQAILNSPQAGYFQPYASLPVKNISLHKMTYRTQYQGNPITASGVFIIPEGYNPGFPTVVYTHGTLYKDEAPSLNLSLLGFSQSTEVFLCAVLASSFNCVVLMPDYIGYGDSQSIVHPYIHAESIGQASLDLIRAYKEYAVSSFNRRLLITGYSEGGFGAVALQKKIQENPQVGLKTDKTIAGSGPYDNVAFAQSVLGLDDNSADKHFISSYLWAFQMYKTEFAYSRSYDDIFSAEDNAILKAAGYDLAYFAPKRLAINTNPTLLFNENFRNAVVDGTETEFLQILAANSLTEFVPTDSLLFVCGSADDWVYPENTHNAYDKMRSKGCKVWMYEEAGGDHNSTFLVYLDILLQRLSLY